MKNPFDLARTAPLKEKTKSAADAEVHFTPVEVPAPKGENVTGALMANLNFAVTTVNIGRFRCPVCGSNLDNVDLFCLTCGEFLEAGEAQNIAEEIAAPAVPSCDDCGTETNPDEVFCMSCGSAI